MPEPRAAATRRVILGSLALAGLAVLGGPAAAFKREGEPKIAFIYGATAQDGGWNEALDKARAAVEEQLGVTIAVTENVPEEATALKNAIDRYVKRGFNIIVGTTYGYSDGILEAAKQYPGVKFVGVDQGVCVDETGKGDPTFACKGDAKTLLPNYQGLVFKEEQVGYLAGVLAGSVTKTGVIGTVGGINTIPAVVRYINGYRNGAKSVKDDIDVKVAYVSTDITKAFNDPGTGKSIAQQMIGQKADSIFQVAGLSGAGAIEAACATDNVIGIGVDVDQSKSLSGDVSCVLTSAEKKLVDAVTAAIKKIGDKTDVGGTVVWDASTDPVGVGLSPYQGDFVDLVTPDIQAKIDAALAGMKDGSVDPCKPTACDDKS